MKKSRPEGRLLGFFKGDLMDMSGEFYCDS